MPDQPICAHCGEPVEVEGGDRFETPEDAAAAGPLLHHRCLGPYSMRDRPGATVYFYDRPDGGPLAG